MGCGSSQSTPVVSSEIKENVNNEVMENGKKRYRKCNLQNGIDFIKNIFHIFKCNATAPPEAFEVAFEGDSDESIIKKHPPKRLLQRLVETPNPSPPTIEDLEEKLANAEIRRNKVNKILFVF